MQFFASDNEETLPPVDGDTPAEAARSYCWDWGPSESLCVTVGWGQERDDTLTHSVDYWVEISNDNVVSVTAQRPGPNAGALDASYRLAVEMDQRPEASITEGPE